MEVTVPLVLLGGVVLLLIILNAVSFDRPIRQRRLREMLLFITNSRSVRLRRINLTADIFRQEA